MAKHLYLYFSIFCFFLIGTTVSAYSQRGDIRVMFYNTENLFDTINNPYTHDEEFLSDGDKHWNNYRYWKKVKKTFQVIAAVGEIKPPELIGFCEVETFLPLYHITQNTPLSKYSYSIIHKESPDYRGIDVALIYRPESLKLLNKEFIPVIFPSDTSKRTRDILLASFLVNSDTLQIFVNHWPSRRGGQAYSEPFRIHTANVVQSKIDSLQRVYKNAKIIVMGDFNDEPHNKSLNTLSDNGLKNLSKILSNECNCGTYKFQTKWNMLDQILVSPPLLNQKGLHTRTNSLKIFDSSFLLKNDDKNGGEKPYRTYLGPQYIGGYSDHLPIYIDLFFHGKATD